MLNKFAATIESQSYFYKNPSIGKLHTDKQKHETLAKSIATSKCAMASKRWTPLPASIVVTAVGTYKFTSDANGAKLPIQIGDLLYAYEVSPNGKWLHGHLLESASSKTLLDNSRGDFYTGVFPIECVSTREVLDKDVLQHWFSFRDGRWYKNDASTQAQYEAEHDLTDVERKARDEQLLNMLRSGQIPPLECGANVASKQPLPLPLLNPVENIGLGTEPIISEIGATLKEWHIENHAAFLSAQYPKASKTFEVGSNLNSHQEQLRYATFTDPESAEYRIEMVWMMVDGNKILGSQVIIRSLVDGRLLNCADSPVEISKQQATMSCLPEPPKTLFDVGQLYHMLADISGTDETSRDITSFTLQLVKKGKNGQIEPLSETFSIERSCDGTMSPHSSTLFADLAAADILDKTVAESKPVLIIKGLAQFTPVVSKHLKNARSSVSMREEAAPIVDSRPSSQSGPSGFKKNLKRMSAMVGVSKYPTSKFPQMETLSEDTTLPPPRTSSETDQSSLSPGLIPQTGKKTVAIAVIDVKDIFEQAGKIDKKVQLLYPSAHQDPSFLRGEEDGWDKVLRDLVPSQSGYWVENARANPLNVTFQPFTAPDGATLIATKPTLLSDVVLTPKIAFSGVPTQQRNDFYVHVDTARFPLDGPVSRFGGGSSSLSKKLKLANIHVTLEVRNEVGHAMSNVIYGSSNSGPITTWDSATISKNGKWCETLRLDLTPHDAGRAHLAMSVAEAGHQPFAVSHMPLWQDDAFVGDGRHSLVMYKPDDATTQFSAGAVGDVGYLNSSWDAARKQNGDQYCSLEIKTSLASTVLSQDKILLGILKWNTLSSETVIDLLKQFSFVSDIEIVKHRARVFDTLFSILAEHRQNEVVQDLVFKALISALGIVHDLRFNLGPLVDKYTEQNFQFPYVTQCLVRSFLALLKKSDEGEAAKNLRATFKVTNHMLKFIARSHQQQVVKHKELDMTNGSPDFTTSLKDIFVWLNRLMGSGNAAAIGTQTIAVQNFHTWLPELTSSLSKDQILMIAIDFIDTCEGAKGKLLLHKLILINNISQLEIFGNEEDQAALVANTVRWLAPHWGKTTEVTQQYREQVRLCSSIVATQMPAILSFMNDGHISNIVDSYLVIQSIPREQKENYSTLFPSSYPITSKPLSEISDFDEALIELAAVMAFMSRMGEIVPSRSASEEELIEVTHNILLMQLSILNNDAFPKSWLSLHVAHHRWATTILQELSEIMVKNFVPPSDAEGVFAFPGKLWKLFFKTLLAIITSDALAIETFGPQKMRAAWVIADDVRKDGAQLMRKIWDSLGWPLFQQDKSKYGMDIMSGAQLQFGPEFAPDFVRAVVGCCLHVHENVAAVGLHILKALIAAEFDENAMLNIMETALFEGLEYLFKEKGLRTQPDQELFLIDLGIHFGNNEDESSARLRTTVDMMCKHSIEFLHLLQALSDAEQTDKASYAENSERLLELLLSMGKIEAYRKRLHELESYFVEHGNHIAAAKMMERLSALLEWNMSKQLSESPEFPVQSMFERKEMITLRKIQHSEDGGHFVGALLGYQELLPLYANYTWNWLKSGKAQKAHGTIMENIHKGVVKPTRHWRVSFSASKSRDAQEFIYTGTPDEATWQLVDRLQEEHPLATVTDTLAKEDDGELHIKVQRVEVQRDLAHEVLVQVGVPRIVRDWELTKNPQRFVVVLKEHVIDEDEDLFPVEEQYIELLVLLTAAPFPTVSGRSPIVDVQRYLRGPLEVAVDKVHRAISELLSLEKMSLEDRAHLQKPLDMIYSTVLPTRHSVVHYKVLLTTVVGGGPGGNLLLGGQTPVGRSLTTAFIEMAQHIDRILRSAMSGGNDQMRHRAGKCQTNFEELFGYELKLMRPQPAQIEETDLPFTRSNSELSLPERGRVFTAATEFTEMSEGSSGISESTQRHFDQHALPRFQDARITDDVDNDIDNDIDATPRASAQQPLGTTPMVRPPLINNFGFKLFMGLRHESQSTRDFRSQESDDESEADDATVVHHDLSQEFYAELSKHTTSYGSLTSFEREMDHFVIDNRTPDYGEQAARSPPASPGLQVEEEVLYPRSNTFYVLSRERYRDLDYDRASITSSEVSATMLFYAANSPEPQLLFDVRRSRRLPSISSANNFVRSESVDSIFSTGSFGEVNINYPAPQQLTEENLETLPSVVLPTFPPEPFLTRSEFDAQEEDEYAAQLFHRSSTQASLHSVVSWDFENLHKAPPAPILPQQQWPTYQSQQFPEVVMPPPGFECLGSRTPEGQPIGLAHFQYSTAPLMSPPTAIRQPLVRHPQTAPRLSTPAGRIIRNLSEESLDPENISEDARWPAPNQLDPFVSGARAVVYNTPAQPIHTPRLGFGGDEYFADVDDSEYVRPGKQIDPFLARDHSQTLIGFETEGDNLDVGTEVEVEQQKRMQQGAFEQEDLQRQDGHNRRDAVLKLVRATKRRVMSEQMATERHEMEQMFEFDGDEVGMELYHPRPTRPVSSGGGVLGLRSPVAMKQRVTSYQSYVEDADYEEGEMTGEGNGYEGPVLFGVADKEESESENEVEWRRVYHTH